MITFFVCNDIEEGWYRYLSDRDEQLQLEHERDEDRALEEELAHDHVANPDDPMTWPWYADAPSEVCRPQIFETHSADLPPGMVGDAAEEDEDLEVAIENEDDYRGADHE